MSELSKQLKAAAVTATDAPTGVDVVLLADALRIAALSVAPAPVAPVVKGRYGYKWPSESHLFLAYCPENGTEFFATQHEAEARAHDLIQDWREDGWGEDVDKVFVAQIISRSTQCDRVDKPAELDEEGCDGEGEYWDADWEYKCNYKLMPVGAPPVQEGPKGVEAALKFYADPTNWRSPTTGFAAQYDPEPSPIQKDRGQKARVALERLLAGN